MSDAPDRRAFRDRSEVHAICATSIRGRHGLRPRRRACATLLTLAVLASGCKPEAPAFHGIDITGADYARDFHLPDLSGTERSLADFRGKYLLVFFGFAQCPDVCPTALSRAVEMRRLLGPAGREVQVVFITVDPERDTPAVLRDYMAAFDPEFIALRGTAQQTLDTAKAFKAFYQKVPTGQSYTMDHSAVTYVFDAGGHIRLALRHEGTAEQYAHDLRLLMGKP